MTIFDVDLTVSIIVVICVVVWMVYVYFFVPTPKPVKEKIDVNALNIGDLVFMCGNTYAEKVFRGIGECPYSHVGIVVELENKKCMLEADVGQGYRSGVRVIPLETKFERWKGFRKNIGVRKFNGNLSKLKGQLEGIIGKDMRNMDNMFWSWVSGSPQENVVFCSQLVSEIFPQYDPPCQVDPGYIMRSENTPHGNLETYTLD